MKKFATILIVFLTLCAITIALIFINPQDFIKTLPIINKLYNNTTLTINNSKGRSQIVIDGKDSGQTNQTISDLSEGTHTIVLKRIVDDTDSVFYREAVFKVDLANNTESIIDVEIGPDGLLYGYSLFYTPLSSFEQDKSVLSINSPVIEADIHIDNEYKATTPIHRIELKASSYKLTALASGYQNVELPIILRKGYNLNVNVYLFPIPSE
jgi:hypothetical protein